MEQEPVDLPPAGRRIIAVGGSKGGVGKSLVAVNLAVYLAQLGRRVVLVDADATGANLHLSLGLPPLTSLSRADRTTRRRATTPRSRPRSTRLRSPDCDCCRPPRSRATSAASKRRAAVD